MKLFSYIFILVLFISCSSHKQNLKHLPVGFSTPSFCPENGTCTLEIIKNKSVIIKNSFGDTFPEFIDSNKLILKFQYLRHPIPNTQDSAYKEIILIELNSDLNELDFSSINFENATIYFGRLCFCRGQNGYFKVTKGNLSIIQYDAKNFNLEFDFIFQDVPHVVNSINQSFEL